MIIHELEGATPLDPNELAGLKLKHVGTRRELDEVEQANIIAGLLWLRAQRVKAIADMTFVLLLHKKLFGEVWNWAGSFRKTEKNIGVDPLQISQQLRNLLDDAVAWHRYETYPPRQALLRLHHGIVKIHPFANGNGRFARIYTDLVADKLYDIAPIQWGNADLQRTSIIRSAYIAALRAADGNDFSPLFELFDA
ncbi:mobile mystery protein B [Pseudidiomarina mangrovi]|uniref:mobile mystery protein B n=1 Tax=Pseudidiomarina mangrovi TaxID=2487133 RepID=UPI000FC9F04E|nr:mobile mystery protein B [Pseudidiomarina mangrovi]